MRYFITVLLIILSILIVSSCKKQQPPSKINQDIPVQEKTNDNSAKEEQPTETPAQPVATSEDEGKTVDELFIDKDRVQLSYKGYTISKKYKTIPYYANGEKFIHEIPYSTLTKNGKLIKRFAWGGSPISASDFGLFHFLKEQTNQLIVAQTFPKTGRFWIVRLYPAYRLLLDTNDYADFRQQPIIIDIDKDGIYEMFDPIWDFEAVKSVATVNTPQPIIIFKYDKNADRFFPANHIFRKYALNGIEKDIQDLKARVDTSDINDSEEYYHQRVEILLRYIFAGKENEGWAFFDKYYNLSDKQKIKAKIKAVLRKQPAYRFIYSKRATRW